MNKITDVNERERVEIAIDSMVGEKLHELETCLIALKFVCPGAFQYQKQKIFDMLKSIGE